MYDAAETDFYEIYDLVDDAIYEVHKDLESEYEILEVRVYERALGEEWSDCVYTAVFDGREPNHVGPKPDIGIGDRVVCALWLSVITDGTVIADPVLEDDGRWKVEVAWNDGADRESFPADSVIVI